MITARAITLVAASWLAAWPLVSYAQSDEDLGADADAEAADDAGAAEPADAEPAADDAAVEPADDGGDGAEPALQAAPAAPAGDLPPLEPGVQSHVVTSGDTLWDISSKYLSNPWYWPKIWSFNPEIQNPHLIYPGNVVRLAPGTEELPRRLEVGGVEGTEGAEGAGEAAGTPVSGAEPEEDMGGDTGVTTDSSGAVIVDVPGEADLDELVRVVGNGPIVYQVKRGGVMARRERFVPLGKMDSTAIILGDTLDRTLFASRDVLWVETTGSASLPVGSRWSVFRTVQDVRDVSGQEHLAWLTSLLGSAQVTRVEGKRAQVTLIDAFEPIERGDFLAPYRETAMTSVSPTVVSDRTVSGHVVAAIPERSTAIGDQQTVYIDKGSRDGMRAGDVLYVLRQTDAIESVSKKFEVMPPETIGTLVVLDPGDRVSSAFVVWALRELKVGDRVDSQSPDPGARLGSR